MKKRIITILILSALICATGLTGCKESGPTITETETTTTETSISTTVTTEATTITTEATTLVTEPTTTEVKTQAPTEKPTEPPRQSNNSSSNNQQSNKNDEPQEVVTPTQSQEKPNNKPNNKPSTKPNTNQTVTDDTPIPHNQLCTDANMSKVTTGINNYFISKGMIYNESLRKDSCGWFYSTTAYESQSTRSVNEIISREIQGFEAEADAFLSASGATYSDISFYCYAEKQSNGEYNIYFCHE